MTWNLENRMAFRECVEDLLCNPQVQKMRGIRQHVDDANCLQHCLFVAYLSFLFCRKFHLDAVSAARGGLLHDLYLYDWRTHKGNHMMMHPITALVHATHLFELNDMEKDIIVKHMWPLTPWLPRYLESFVVSGADKLCALAEIFHVYRWLHVDENLDFLPKEPALPKETESPIPQKRASA